MKRSGFAVGLVLVAAAAAGVWYWRSHGSDNAQTARGQGDAPVAIVSAAAVQADFPVRKRAIGFVETPASVVVRSRIDSQIMQQHVTDGQFVKAGDLLFTLDDRDIKAQIAKDEAMLARDEATHTRNVADLERYKQLFARNAGTQAQVDQATADERSSAASIQGDHATLDADRLKLSYTRITAPIDGRIGAVQVTPGNLVNANANSSSTTGLLTITQMKPLRVTFAMPEHELPTLQGALAAAKPISVTARVPNSGRPPVSGLLNFVDSTVDMNSGTITAKAAFANDDLILWPGQYVDVEIVPETLTGVTVIPTVAVQTGQKGPYAFVVKPDSTVDLRQIKVALSDGDKTAVTDGIAPGERVVIDGQMRLKQGTRVRERAATSEKPPQSTPVAEGALMSISSFCIKHPVATILMSVSLVLAGLFAWRFLPVAALPRAEFPVINVSAQLPGASPDTMATSIATPLIKQFGTIAGIDSISTTNSQGATSIAIQFVLNRDIDAAAADVQAAITRTLRQLPIEMTTPPSYRKVNPADAPIILMALKSDVVPLSQLDAFAQQVISPALSTVEGVAQVLIWGSQKYAVRIQIDPTALAARGIGLDELQLAITAANANTPVGTIQNTAQQLTIQAQTQLANAAQFSNVIIATRGGKPVRLGDVAKVIDSVENTQTRSTYDGTPAIVLAVQRQPDANTVEVVDRVKAMIPAFEEQLPAAAALSLLNDRSTSIRQAVEDVQFTLLLTIALVIMVIFVFLRRVAATFIPAVAVPISIIATLAAMYMLDFSIDNISLLGLTLSVGLVVDDAIVMLENIVRHMEEDGLSAYEASLKGASEIGFTIISISLSLVAVFIPVLLMGGVIGRIFNEFAVVVTVSILASAFVSLTLTPMLCSRLLSGYSAHHQENALGRILEKGFDKLLAGYDYGLKFCLRFQPLMLLAFFLTMAGTVWLLQTTPKGFFPQEDIGQLQVSTEARQDISFDAMLKLQSEVADIFRKSPYVAHVASSVGGNGGGGSALNSGRLFVELKPLDERPRLPQVLASLRRDLGQVAGINTYMVPVQNLNIGARSSKSQYQLVVQGLDQALMNDWSLRLADAMSRDRAVFADVTTDLQNNALQATLTVDRDKANALGIGADILRSTLYSGFGVRQVSTIYTTGDNYNVVVEFNPNEQWTPERLNAIRVRTKSGTLVPLGSFARVERTAGQLTVNQLGQLPAVTISYNLPPGVALGDSVNRINALKEQIGLPKSLSTTLAGTAKTFQDSLANQGLLIAGAILTIYIVLGILYESFIHPLTILTGLPSAAIGALGALRLFDMDLSVIAIIGLLMLIGIVKKNAIMMIDVALVLRREGEVAQEAIHRACLMRFRPILMTTLAALMGTLPIALGAGASAELRQPLGIAVVGGLMISQVLTLFITPVLFLYMDRLSDGLTRLFFGKQKPEHTAHPAE